MDNFTQNEIFDILQRNVSLLRKYQVKRIGLFGSYSTNQTTSKSDIDLVVDFEEKSFDNFMDLSFALEDLFNKKIDLITEESISPYILPLIQKEIQWYEA